MTTPRRRRRQAGGPDHESNGLALSSLHHKLFDMGVFTVLADLRIGAHEEFVQAALAAGAV